MKDAERTLSDWVQYSGYRSSRQSNFHPRTPDPARLEELSKVKTSDKKYLK
jgi:hypothetical protein